MPQLTINGTTYNFPDSGEDPNWSEELIAWAEAITEAFNDAVAGTGDILESSAAIANNTSVAADVNGLQFTTATVKSAIVNYQCYIDAGTTGNSETGIILLTYDDTGSVGNKWLMSLQKVGDAGISLSITDAGQVQYISSNLGSALYTRRIVFSAKVLNRI
jgi:hypothetical protein